MKGKYNYQIKRPQMAPRKRTADFELPKSVENVDNFNNNQ